MKNIAIEGHTTRGKEVIEILEMLGGDNTNHYTGTCIDRIYFVNGNRDIDSYRINSFSYNFQIFILEEFLKKYPYKVGDMVRVPEYESEVCIDDMRWNGDEIQYSVSADETESLFEWYSVGELNKCNEPHKEEIAEEKIYIKLAPDLKVEGRKFGYKIPNGYEFECVRENEIILKPINSQYPKTYCECCDVLQVGFIYELKELTKDEAKLMDCFISLKRCRDAYWKIAGEEMGLGKPWKPDWTNPSERKYCIVNTEEKVTKWVQKTTKKILAFPTEEMRDIFYENFKDLIEECKELL
jgi:hypothetical protein